MSTIAREFIEESQDKAKLELLLLRHYVMTNDEELIFNFAFAKGMEATQTYHKTLDKVFK